VTKVNFYAGYTGQERPVSFEWKGTLLYVAEVLEKRVLEDFHTRRRRTVYLVKTDTGVIYELLDDAHRWRVRRLDSSHFA